MPTTKPPGYSDEQWAKFDPQRQQQLSQAAVTPQGHNSQGATDEQWASMTVPERYKLADTNAAADAAKNYRLSPQDQSAMAGIKGSLYGVKGKQGSDEWFNALKQSYDFQQRTGIDPNTGRKWSENQNTGGKNPYGDFESFVKAHIPTDRSGGRDPSYQQNYAAWTAKARGMGGAPAAAGALGASVRPQQPPPVTTGQINTLPQGPTYYQQSGADPRFMSGAMGGEQDPGPYSRNLPPAGGGYDGKATLGVQPPAGPTFEEAVPPRPPTGGVLQKPVADPGPYSRNLPQSVATGQINNLPQGPIYSQAAQLQAQGGLNAKIMPKIRQQNPPNPPDPPVFPPTDPTINNPLDPRDPNAYQNQRWTGLERGQEYDANDVYKYMPQYQPGLNYKDAWLEGQVARGALSGVAMQENDAVQRLLAGLDSAQKTKNDLSMGVASQEGDAAQQALNQLGAANPVSVSAKDPGVAAAMNIFKQSVAPQIDSQYSLMGLGRSQNKADALNRSMVEALAPQLSEQRQYNEAGAQRKQNQSQFLSDLLMNVGGRRREGLVQGEQLAQGAYGNLAESLLGIGSQRRQGMESEMGFGERAANTQRDFEKNMADSAERERLRLQNLYLGAVSPPGLPTGTSSSKDK